MKYKIGNKFYNIRAKQHFEIVNIVDGMYCKKYYKGINGEFWWRENEFNFNVRIGNFILDKAHYKKLNYEFLRK